MVLVLVVVLCLVLTEQIARGLGIERAVGLLSLATLATLLLSKLLPRPQRRSSSIHPCCSRRPAKR